MRPVNTCNQSWLELHCCLYSVNFELLENTKVRGFKGKKL